MFLKTTSNIGLACLLASYPFVSPLAYNDILDPYAFNGATIGVGVGANTFMSKINQNNVFGILEAPPGTESSFDASNRIYQYGIMGNILAGYGHVSSNSFYLGTELGLNFFQPTETSFSYTAQTTFSLSVPFNNNTLIHSTTEVRRNDLEPTLDVKIGGLVMPNVLAYLRGGINYNNLKIKSQTFYSSQAPEESELPSPTSLLTHSQSKNSIGFRVGAGFEYMATSSLGISANYIYTFYRNLTDNVSGTVDAATCDVFEGCVLNSIPVEELNKGKANDQQVLIGLIYHFG